MGGFVTRTVADWQAALPDLRRKGRELAGPCPLCGGDDRFHVAERDGRALVGCRGCIDGLPEDTRRKRFGEIVAVVFPDRPAANGAKGRRAESGDVVPFIMEAPDGSRDRPFRRRDEEALSMILADLHIEIRHNLRTKRDERRDTGPHFPNDWQPFDDRWACALRDRIHAQYYYGSSDDPKPLYWGMASFYERLNSLLHYREVDPFQRWLDELPEWDGSPRLHTLLQDMLGAPEDELSIWASTFLVLGPLQRTMQPGSKLDEFPVLIGEQNIGKSATLCSIVPPHIPGLFSDGFRWDVRDKEQVEATLGAAIVEVAEMGGRGRAELENMKATISRQDDGFVRLPWRRNTEPLPRRFVFVGTTNNENDLPNDPSGNRRFVPVPLTQNRVGKVETYIEARREQLWAEAVYLREQKNMDPRLPRAYHAAQRARAELHRDRDDLVEDVVTQLPSAGEYTMARLLEMAKELASDSLKGLTPHRLGKALRQAGWTQRKTAGQRLWLPPLEGA